ncbi:HNH endonuclease [Brachybacterium sp. EF45031]|uniref:HNH endonuclease signature motif containing protein n=1 Tax=Brachybacterium sillae TaxID=2810536 RepID=UPI0025597FE7|nr:HNH endonuclease signature motif containing protein [Brachybacterium sillae]MCS6711324.1 HNH endonuclease [Brachybacterium sillae]
MTAPATDRPSAPAAGSPAVPVAELLERERRRQRDRSRLLADQLEDLAPLHALRENSENDPFAPDEVDAALAASAHLHLGQAAWSIRRAHRAVTHFGTCLEVLRSGAFPERWFEKLLSDSDGLPDDACPVLDTTVAGWDLERLDAPAFSRRLGREIRRLQTREATPPEPRSTRSVELCHTDPRTGTGTLLVQGPALDILALGHQLDQAARDAATAQRAALARIRELLAAGDESGAEQVEIPYDPEGVVAATGRALSRRELRFLILTRSVRDVDGTFSTAPRFRLTVTVPALTLMGGHDPALIEGATPIPADMARRLAGSGEGAQEWFRILTDPMTGRFLERDITRYTPSAQMLEHLRLRHPECAAPGCSRPTVVGAEADHIEEFDHRNPLAGGPTSLENLHLLCWRHHQLKTARRIDPHRFPDDPPGRTRWTLGPPGLHPDIELDVDIDIITFHSAAALHRAAAMADRARERDGDPPTVRDPGPPPF